MPFDKITIINIQPPERADINTELQYLGAALGLFGERDKDSSCFRVFVTLVRAAAKHNTLTSDDIAAQTRLTRGTVVHHLNKLREAQLITSADRGYTISEGSMHKALQALSDQVTDTLNLLQAVAEDIEKRL